MGKSTILIVEDDPDIVQMLECNLHDEGYDTLAAMSGEDGMRLAIRGGVDLIILDIMLPRLDGFDVCRTLKARPGVVHSRDRILDAVIGDDAIVSDRTVDAHVKSLRRKMGEAREHIETIRGAGYRFREDLQ